MHPSSIKNCSLRQFVTDRCLIDVTLAEHCYRKRHGCVETEKVCSMFSTKREQKRMIRSRVSSDVCICVLQWLSWRGSLHGHCVHLRAAVPTCLSAFSSVRGAVDVDVVGVVVVVVVVLLLRLVLGLGSSNFIGNLLPNYIHHNTPETSALACRGTTGKLLCACMYTAIIKYIIIKY